MVKRVHPWSLAKSSGENFGLRRERNGGNGRREGPDKGRENKIPAGAAMKECMETTPVEDITVKQLVEKCGLTRQTFYRSFLDKYDLINWYFDKLLAKSFEHMGRGRTVYDALVKKFTYIQEERTFFRAAFRYDEQNSLRQHDFELILAFYEDLIREKTGKAPEESIHYLLEMYCQSSIYMTVKWVTGRGDIYPGGPCGHPGGRYAGGIGGAFRES